MPENKEPHIPPMISVSEMGRLLGISRSRLYQLIDSGIILPPAYLIDSHRAVYTEEMARRNLQVKQQNTGINGQIIIFYARRAPKPAKLMPEKHETPPPSQDQGLPQELVETLESLGMTDVTVAQITQALTSCFPGGTENLDQGEVVKTVFRHLRSQNSGDSVG